MELEKKYIHKNERKSSAYVQTTVEDDYNLPDYKPDIVKLIDTRGELEIEEIKVSSQSVFVQGKIRFAVLYRGEGTDRMISSLSGEIPFREKLNMEGVEELDPVLVKATVADPGISVINSRKLSLRSIVEFSAEARQMQDATLCSNVAPEEGYEIKKSQRELLQLVENKKDIFRIRQELSLPKEKPNGNELLWDIVTMEQVSTRLMGDGVEIGGIVRVCLLYQGMDEAPFTWYETSVPVKSVVPCQTKDGADHFLVRIWDIRSLVQLQEDGDGELRQIGLEVDAELEVSLWKEEVCSCVEDMYSLSKELVLSREPVVVEQVLIKNDARCKISGDMELEESDEVLYLCGVHGTVHLHQTEILEDGVKISGEVAVEFLCITADDDLPLSRVSKKFPFTQILEARGIQTGDRVEITTAIDHLQVNLADARHAALRGEIQLNMMVFARENISALCSVEEREMDLQKLQERPGMIGYIIQKDDSLWDIARENHTTVDSLRESNHLESDVLMPGQKLLITKSVLPQMNPI